VALAKAEEMRDHAAKMPAATSEQAEAVLAVWRQADDTLAQGETALATGIAARGLRQRVQEVRQDVERGRQQAEASRARAVRKEKLFHGLNEARMARGQWVEKQITLNGPPEIHFDFANSAKKYAVAFMDFGLGVAGTSADKLAARIAAEEEDVREAVIIALDDWAFAAAKIPQAATSSKDLQALAQAVDTDPWRKRFRAAVAADDLAALKALSIEAQESSLPLSNLQLAAISLDDRGERKQALELLRWGRDRDPKDFRLILELGGILCSSKNDLTAKKDRDEALSCYRAGVALLPAASAAHNNLGHILAMRSDGEAMAEFRRAVELDPKNANAHNNLGNALLANNAVEAAAAEFRLAIEHDPQNADAYANLGKALAAQNQLDDAIVKFHKAHELDPSYETAHCALGNYLASKSRFDAAVAEYRKAIDLDRNRATIYFRLGATLRTMRKFGEAVTAQRKAIELAPDYAEAYGDMGQALLEQGDFAAALKALDRAKDLESRHDRGWLSQITSTAQLAKRLIKAELRVQAIIKGEDKIAKGENLIDVLEVCRYQQRNAAGAKVCAAALPTGPYGHPVEFFAGARFAALAAAGKGIDADKLDDKERAALRQQALQWLRAAPALLDPTTGQSQYKSRIDNDLKRWQDDPDLADLRDKDALAKLSAADRELWQKFWADVAAMVKKVDDAFDAQDIIASGIRLRNQKQSDNAIAKFREAIALAPDLAYGHYFLGLALHDKKQWGDAIFEYRKAIALAPDLMDGHYYLGVALHEKKQLEDAIVEYRKAISLWPNRTGDFQLGNSIFSFELELVYVHFHLGNALSEKKQWDDAIFEYRKAIELGLKFAVVHYNLGIALRAKNQLDDAAAAYREAIKIDPNYAEAYCNMAQVLQLQGHFADALQAFKRGHELGTRRGAQWGYNSAQWVADAERMAKLEARLPAVLKGEDKVADNADLEGLKEVCRIQGRFLKAAKLFEVAFFAAPKLADDVKTEHRFRAACFAALAVAGRGVDADKLDDKERAHLRQQALEWLRADLAHWTKQAASAKPADRVVVRQTLQYWQHEPDLTNIRDKNALAKMPEEERAAWEKLWADVQILLKPTNVAGAIEGEKLKVRGSSADFRVFPQGMEQWKTGFWSGESQLLGTPEKNGAWTDLEVPVNDDGTYQFVAHMTQAPDFAIVRFSVDGKVVGEPFDGYAAQVASPVPVALGQVTLKKGVAVLRVEVVGANPKAVKDRYYWGLDYLTLTPVK
jgi:tetratricopeptide (TPR) repeat protein